MFSTPTLCSVHPLCVFSTPTLCSVHPLCVFSTPTLCVFLPQLQSELDQEYQDKFRRLPVEIQEFVQDSSKTKLSDDSPQGNISVSSTTERLTHKASQSEDDTEDGSSERVYDTPL